MPALAVKNRTILLLLTLFLGACGEDFSPFQNGGLRTGTWGGENAGLILDDTIAHVHIGCTYGNFPAPFKPTSSGDIHATGSYQVRAYPIAVGPSVPAALSGNASSDRFTFTVVVNDTVEKKTVTYGPVTVYYGKDPALGPCPICRKPKALR